MDISKLERNLPPLPPTASPRARPWQSREPDTPPQDTVTLGSAPAAEEALTYADPRKAVGSSQSDNRADQLRAALAESDRKVEEFMQLLGGLVEQQGLEWKKLVSGEQKLTADPETIQQAQAAIAEDGEFGVRKTAERILSFARLAMGDDPDKLETIRNAVTRGFDEAKQMLGGELPEISQQTYSAIMDEFDRWAKDGLPQGEISLARNTPPAADAV